MTDEPTAPEPRRRLRLSVRTMLSLVAVAALAMLAYVEVMDGMPPRFVLRGIPARIAKLEPGMSRPEVRRIMGLDRPWHEGGIGPTFERVTWMDPLTVVVIRLRPRGAIAVLPSKTTVRPPTASIIHLNYASDRLHSAACFAESGMIIKMRKPR